MEYGYATALKKFKDNGIYYTPPELAEYLKSYFDSENVSEILDPTMGHGSLLTVFGDEVKKYGFDTNSEAIDWAKENVKGDFAETDFLELDFEKRKYKHIIANPPFSVKWKHEESRNVEIFKKYHDKGKIAPKKKADWAFICAIWEVLEKNGLAVVLHAPGTLYRGNAEKEIRKTFIKNGWIKKIVEIDGNKFEDTAISTVLIVLRKDSKNTGEIELESKEGKAKTVKIEEIERNDWNLSVNSYIEPPRVDKFADFDPVETEKAVRRGIIENLKKQIEMSEKLREIDERIPPVSEFVKDIKEMLKGFENDR